MPVRVTDAFAVRLELRSQRTPARFEMALYRSGDRSDGNAVVYTAGEGLAIESRSARGATPLTRSRQGVTLEDGAVHVLEWRRNRAGAMSVLVDGVALVEVEEPGKGFSGLALRNRGGEFAVRSLTVRGTP